jgi:hypothetical protein
VKGLKPNFALPKTAHLLINSSPHSSPLLR